MKTQRRPPLDHISGMRALLSGWIVLGHYCSFPPQEGVFTLLLGRGYVAVQGFIILSGFITHYAYHDARYDAWPTVLRFYAKRFGAILGSYYLFYALTAAWRVCFDWDGVVAHADSMLLSLVLCQAWLTGVPGRVSVPGVDGNYPRSSLSRPLSANLGKISRQAGTTTTRTCPRGR